MCLILLLLITNTILNTIPEEYNDIVKEAKANAIYKKKNHLKAIQKDKHDIYYPGHYTVGPFNFVLNSVVTGDSTKSLLGYAFDDIKNVAAIISSREPNTTSINSAKDTVLSVSSHSDPIKIKEIIADDGEVTIVKYNNIDPLSIFNDFHISDLRIPEFKKIYTPLKSYLGNDIFRDFGGSKTVEKYGENGRVHKLFLGLNWPEVSVEKDISQQEPLYREFEIKDINGQKHKIKSNIGGVIGLVAAFGSDIVDDRNSKIALSLGFEVEAQIKFTLPKGEFKDIGFTIVDFPWNMFDFNFNLMNILFLVNLTAHFSMGIKNFSFSANHNLTFNARRGYKTQTAFNIYSFGKKNKPEAPSSYKSIPITQVPSEQDFEASKFNFDTSLSLTLDADLYYLHNNNSNSFSVKGGIDYRTNYNLENYKNLCPNPYLLTREIHKVYAILETTNPLKIGDLTIFPKKKYLSDTPIWTSKASKPYCLGGNYFSYDFNRKDGQKNSAVLLIKTVKYTTENKDHATSEFKISASYYPRSLFQKPQIIDFASFTIPKDKIASGSAMDLNYFAYFDEFYDDSYLMFDCIDEFTNKKFYDPTNMHGIGNGLKDSIHFTSAKGTTIVAEIQAYPSINCEFNVETSCNIYAKFASVKPNLHFGDSIGLIYNKQGSICEIVSTIINDHYAINGINDCIYNIKNVWMITIETLDINPSEDFISVLVSFDKIDGKTTKVLFSKEVKKEDLESIKNSQFTFEIPKPDVHVKMNVIIKKSLFSRNFKENDIKVDHNFFLNEENTMTINSNTKDKWSIKLKFNPFNYPIIYDIDQISSDSSLIFARAFKLQTPFSQQINNKSPSINRFECIFKSNNEKYGIFKLEFEIDDSAFDVIDFNINALLIMKKLKPLCDVNKISDDSYIIKIPKNKIKKYTNNGKTIALYPIPFCKENDDRETDNQNPSITLVDVFVSPSENEDYCGKIQNFPKANSHIHTACILIINEETQGYNYKAIAAQTGISVNQYSYPLNSNLDVDWKLIGISLNSNDKSKTYPILLWQPEVKFPIDSYNDLIRTDVTKYLSNNKEKYTLICPRCSNIDYAMFTDPIEKGTGIVEQNDKFSFNIEKGKETSFYAKCKNDEQINCMITINNLDRNKLALVSVPLISEIVDDGDFYDESFDKNYIIYKNIDNQFTSERDTLSYFTSTQSKLSILHVFENKFIILIIAKQVGQYIRVSAFAEYVRIPFFRLFKRNKENFDILSIKSNNDETIAFELLGGSLFISSDVSLDITTTSIDASFAKDLFGIGSNFVESIYVNYNELGEKRILNENSFCFIQYEESKCSDQNNLPLRYPEFNNFAFLVNDKSNTIFINVDDDLTNFYPIFGNLESKEINITCRNQVKIKGEMIIPEKIKVNFIGPFDLTQFKITINVNLDDESCGVISFSNDVNINSIDVDVISKPSEENHDYYVEMTIIASGNANINLVKQNEFISSFERYLYSISENKFICQYRSLYHKIQNEFCIYQTKRDLCSSLNDMDSITASDLDNFQKYFHGSYTEPIKLHLVENMTFTKQTFKSFIEDHPYTSLIITSDSQDVRLQGTLRCTNNLKLTFIENDQLNIDDLIIEKELSILDLYQANKNKDSQHLIELSEKNVKQITLIISDYPQSNILELENQYLIITNCKGLENSNIKIEGGSNENNYLKYEVQTKIENQNTYAMVTMTVLYNDPNTFCIYSNNLCRVENVRPVKASEIDTIRNLINTKDNDMLKLIISENVDIDLDTSSFSIEGIRSMTITADENLKPKLTGKIKTPEFFKTEISNCTIDGLTLDINTDILQAISSFYNVSECFGKPSIKIVPHDLPMSLNNWGDKREQNIEVLSIKDATGISFACPKLLMEGGFIVQTNSINTQNEESVVSLKYSFEEIKVQPNNINHFCLYESDSSLCTLNVKQIKASDFCSSATFDSITSDVIIEVISDITLPSECNLNYFANKGKRYQINLYGNQLIKGRISISTNTDVAFLNAKLIEELEISIKMQMPQDINSKNIGYGKILLYEGSNPKKLKVDVSSYPKEIESNEYESQQFVQGICLNSENTIPTPSTRDFRIKVGCSNTNGIYGMKLKLFSQKYDSNHFCYYASDITKCIFNENTERYMPIKYSDQGPTFVKNGNDPSIYLFEAPSNPMTISFLMAKINGYEKATIVNKGNGVVKIHIPLDFIVNSEGSFENSEVYLQYNPKTKQHGTLFCSTTNIVIHPIILHHGSFTHSANVKLSQNEQTLTSIFNQENMEISRIRHNSGAIIINNYNKAFDYQYGIDDGTSTNIDFFYGQVKSTATTLLISKSVEINPFKLLPLRFGIRSTKDRVLTLDMTRTRAISATENKYLYIDNVEINSKNKESVDFGDLYVTFHNCKLNSELVNKVKGNHLFFDHQSYQSFFSTKNNLFAFDYDDIESTETFIYLGDERFSTKDIPLIKLHSFNTFMDRYGRTIQFTGANSILLVKQTLPNTKLSFMTFNDLNVIADSIHEIPKFSNVRKATIKFEKENVKSTISDLEVSNDYPTEISTNGQISVVKATLNNNFNGNSKVTLTGINVPEQKNVKIEKCTLSNSIDIHDKGHLTIDSCKFEKEVVIIVESTDFAEAPLTFSNTEVAVSNLNSKFLSEKVDKFVIANGLSSDNCESVKSKTSVFDKNSKDISNDYKIKCENDGSSMKISANKKEKKFYEKNAFKIGLPCGIVGVALIVIVALCLAKPEVFKCRK